MSDQTLLARLKAGKHNYKDVVFPGTGTTIRIQILSNQDTHDAAIAADRLFRELEVAIGFHNVTDFANEKTTQELYRACIDPETKKRIAASVTEFRTLTTPEERNWLIEQYNALAEECNPSPVSLTNEEFDAIVEKVKKSRRRRLGVFQVSTR